MNFEKEDFVMSEYKSIREEIEIHPAVKFLAFAFLLGLIVLLLSF